MAKEQQFMELFPKYDSDKDGQIDSTQLLSLFGELGIDNLYSGSVSNMIRKLNYNNPDKPTLTFQQAKQYFLSFQTACKHDIWKNKYNFHSIAAEIRQDISENNVESAAPAAPGANAQKEQPADKGHSTTVSILIGQDKPIYTSQIEIDVEKKQKHDIPKPFIKLVFTCKTPERAKALEKLFKQNFASFLVLLSQDVLSDWNDELQKMLHINSLVNDTTTTFFITTTNEDVVDYVKLLASMFELSFNYQLTGKGHLKFEFDYDFEKFYTDNLSTLYHIFLKDCKLSLNATAINGIKAIRNYMLKSKQGGYFHHQADTVLILSFLHLEEVDAELEFDNADPDMQYELESKNQFISFLRDFTKIFGELEQGGLKIYQMLELLDDSISIEAIAGEWKVKISFILKNLNKLLLYYAKQSEDEAVPAQQQPDLNSQNSQLSQESQKEGLKKSPSSKLFKKSSSSLHISEINISDQFVTTPPIETDPSNSGQPIKLLMPEDSVSQGSNDDE